MIGCWLGGLRSPPEDLASVGGWRPDCVTDEPADRTTDDPSEVGQSCIYRRQTDGGQSKHAGDPEPEQPYLAAGERSVLAVLGSFKGGDGAWWDAVQSEPPGSFRHGSSLARVARR